mmetsp:Transcript_69783/g.199984  ORF Transcript_69783/g.199984 Transcript_69783/m.199984 type:complete len:271 (-) Transcript_69783:633-1445(-)
MQLLPPMPNPPRRRSAKPRLSAGTVVSSSAPDAAFAMASIACTRPAPAPLLMAIIAAQIAALASCRRCWGRRRRVRRATVRRDAPVRDVGRVLVALLGAAAALVAVKPIHVRGVPVSGHEGHAFLQRSSLHHGIELRIGPHALRDRLAVLGHGRGNDQAAVHDLELLGEGEHLAAVDSVAGAEAELVRGRLELRLAPLVALPIRVAVVVLRACVVRDLLNVSVALVHVELGTTAQTRKALGIAIVVSVLARKAHRHVHQVEVQIATARGG